MTYEQIIQRPGNMIEPKIYYEQDNETVTIGKDEIISLNPHFETNIIGTIMRGAEVELKTQLPSNVDIYIENKAIFGTYYATKNFGAHRVQEEIYNADTRTYTYNLYDEMLQLMIDYDPVDIDFPCTLFEFFSEFLSERNLTTNITSLPNGSRTLNNDPFLGIEYTDRGVLEDIGQATATLFKIENGEVKKCNFGSNTKVIDDDILKNQNISMGEHYGPINTIVLSRAAESDNVYYPDPLPANPIEFKIKDNILMNNDDRSDFLPEIYNALNGIEYDIYDCELTGFGGFEPLDKLQINTLEDETTKTYNSYVLSNSIKITQGYDESIYSEAPGNESTNFKYATADDRNAKTAEIIVDKQNAQIIARVSNVENAETTLSEDYENFKSQTNQTLINNSQAILDEKQLNLEFRQSILQNGSEKVTTSTGYTFDESGLNIHKDGADTNTQITENGMYVKDSRNVDQLIANSQGVIANNLTASGYLITKPIRGEQVTINGEIRYGYFWVGDE